MAKRATFATIQLKVRMPEWLRADIEKAAGKKGLTLNQEIVNRLADSFAVDRTDQFFERVHVAEKAIMDLERRIQGAQSEVGKKAAKK